MSDKYVKDRAHNKYEAYCCEDIDARVGALEAAVAALVAGTVPDGSVTLAKLAADARAHTREINKGLLFSEWVGTQQEYEAHVGANGGEPLANVKYIITGGNGVSDLVVVKESFSFADSAYFNANPPSGETHKNLYTYKDSYEERYLWCAFKTEEELTNMPDRSNELSVLSDPHVFTLSGTWQRIGIISMNRDKETELAEFLTLWQRVTP